MKIICSSRRISSRDPALLKHNGKYYWTFAADGALHIAQAEKIEDFETAQPTRVWTPDREEYAHELWAPELHVIDGICYIYVACDDGVNDNHRMYVLSNGSSDPLMPYQMLGKLCDPTNKWAIDGTVLQHKTGRYFIWSGWEGDENVAQNLYIAKLRSPAAIEGERVLLSRPEYDWEKRGGNGKPDGMPYINEGPAVLNHDGKTYVLYSAAGSWCEHYCISLLELVGDDPMDPTAWRKQDAPTLSRNEQFMGMGHCSVIEEDHLMFFHAWRADEQNIVWHTVYPICAEYRFENGKLIVE